MPDLRNITAGLGSILPKIFGERPVRLHIRFAVFGYGTMARRDLLSGVERRALDSHE